VLALHGALGRLLIPAIWFRGVGVRTALFLVHALYGCECARGPVRASCSFRGPRAPAPWRWARGWL